MALKILGTMILKGMLKSFFGVETTTTTTTTTNAPNAPSTTTTTSTTPTTTSTTSTTPTTTSTTSTTPTTTSTTSTTSTTPTTTTTTSTTPTTTTTSTTSTTPTTTSTTSTTPTTTTTTTTSTTPATTTTTTSTTPTTTTTTTTAAPLVDPYCVSGAGTAIANGTYGYNSGYNGPFMMGYWQHISQPTITMGYSWNGFYEIWDGYSLLYQSSTLTGTWSVQSGTGPAPTVASGECGTTTTTTTSAPTTTTTTTSTTTTTTSTTSTTPTTTTTTSTTSTTPTTTTTTSTTSTTPTTTTTTTSTTPTTTSTTSTTPTTTSTTSTTPTTTTTTSTTSTTPTTTTTTSTTSTTPTTTTTTSTTPTTTTTAAPTTTTTTTTTAAPNAMILSVNSTPRALVGGGVTYDPTFINADYKQYFTSVNNNLNNCILNGYLPLQNNLNSSYSYTAYNKALPTFIFDFRIPTVITKYRMWNGFMANIGVYQRYSDLGNQTPQAWSLQGSNDEINWTTVDTRTSQAMLAYASTNDPATSSYSEFEISSPAAYKSYRLVLSGRGRTGFYCDKSGNNCAYDTQLGEVQLWGYESPSTSCALHGYNTLLPTAKYYTSSGVVTNTDPFSSAFNMGTILSLSNNIAAWTTAKNSDTAFYVATGSTKEGYMGFDYPITLTSYKLWGGSGGYTNIYSSYLSVNSNTTYSFRVYGANTFGTWTLLDTRTLVSIGSAATFTIASPALYSYYRISIFGSGSSYSGKSGTGYIGLIRDIQLQGYLT